PNHTEWQRDLSVSYDRVGDMHKATGDNEAALKAYQDGLAIARKLAALDPNHTEWQRDLSVSHNKVGDMHKATGDNEAALKAYQESLTIRRKLAALDPKIVEWQTDLVVSYYKLAQIQEQKRTLLYRDALNILKRLYSENNQRGTIEDK
ncbi:MAG: tetratricopeptide repeat protein, partial [Campylobacterota bacterium]